MCPWNNLPDYGERVCVCVCAVFVAAVTYAAVVACGGGKEMLCALTFTHARTCIVVGVHNMRILWATVCTQ